MTESTAEAGVEEIEEVEEQANAVATPESTDVEVSGPDTSEEGEEQEEEVELIEFDFAGDKLSIPKGSVTEELVERIDKFTKGTWSDYSKKSQAIVEAAKSLEAREGAVQKLEQLHGETLDTYSRGLAIRNELEQYAEEDLTSLWQSDPDQARRVSDDISKKQAEFNSIISEVSQKESNLAQAKRSEMGRRMDEGAKAVEKVIPGFGAKVPELIEYVNKAFGVPKQEAEMWAVNPAGAVMAYESMLYRRMTAKAKKQANPGVKETVPVTSLKPKGSRAAKPMNGNISADDYRKRWNSQKGNK